MSALNTIVQLVLVLSALIILHEIGHYLGARLFKLDVEEFGIGIPPLMLRLWRQKSRLKIGTTWVKVPAGTRLLQDLEKSTWVEADTQRTAEGEYILRQLKVLDRKQDDLTPKSTPTGEAQFSLRGDLTAVKLGTLFTLNWLPLGGFVKIKGEGDTSVPDGLARANPWKRLVVYFFGPMMNLLLGIALYALMVSQIGMADFSKVLVLDIAKGSPAEGAGLQVGDLLLDINGTLVDGMNTIHEVIKANLGQEIEITFERQEKIQSVNLVPRPKPPEGEGAIGIVMGNPTVPISWFEALPMGVVSTANHSIALVTLPAQVVRGAISPAEARPVGYKGMYDIYQNVQEQELVPGAPQSLNTIWFFTTITISLGILNLLPIPALDGGRILFILPEIIFRRRIPIEIQNLVNMISFTIMILLFFYINYLDFVNPVQLP
jgi:regulator of sigma E protease